MFRAVIAALAVFTMTGCSLVNPFLIDSEVRGKVPRPPAAARTASQASLDSARTYADTVKDKYREALGHQAQLTAWLGLGLIPLSAAAVGIGASGGPSVAVLATGLTGAAAFGSASWLLNRPRQAAWAAGIKAVTCAVDAVEPLDEIDETALGNAITVLETSLPTLEQAIATLAVLAAELERDLGPFDTASFPEHLRSLNEAKAELTRARSVVASAETALTSGAALRRMVKAAGARLFIAIDKITDTVDGIIADSIRDPQALVAIINGLGATYKTLTAVPEAVKPPAPTAERPVGALSVPRAPTAGERQALDRTKQQLDQVLQQVRTLIASINAARRTVSIEVSHVDVAAVVKKLDGCGVKAEDIITKLVLNPAPPYKVSKGSTTGFVASGGVPPYWATVTGAGDAVTATPSGPLSAAFTIAAGKDAPTGTFVVNVFDSRNSAVQAEVTVGDARPAADTGGDSRGPQSPITDQVLKEFAERGSGKVATVTGADLGVKVGAPVRKDGKISVPLDVDRVGRTYKRADLTAAGLIDAVRTLTGTGLNAAQIEVDVDDVAKDADAFVLARGAVCPVKVKETSVKDDSEPLFTALSVERRKQVQRALCVRDDGTWGDNTKHALKGFQCETGRMPSGALTNESVRDLLKIDPATPRCPAPPRPAPARP